MTESTEVREKKKTPATISSSLAALTDLQNRVDRLPVFARQKLTSSEWLFLSLLKNQPSLRAGVIARKLSLTPQRATQIVAALKSAKFVDVSQSAADPRKKDLKVTAAGDKAVAAIEAEIEQRLAPLTGRKANALNGLRRTAAGFSKALGPVEKAEKAAKPARRAGKA